MLRLWPIREQFLSEFSNQNNKSLQGSQWDSEFCWSAWKEPAWDNGTCCILFHVLDINSVLGLSGFTQIKQPYPFRLRYQIGSWLGQWVKKELTDHQDYKTRNKVDRCVAMLNKHNPSSKQISCTNMKKQPFIHTHTHLRMYKSPI